MRNRRDTFARPVERTWLSRLVVVVLLVAVGICLPPANAQQGSFRLQGLKSGELRPADLNQGVVIVVVFASWSPRSRDIVPQVNAIVDRWGGQARVVMVSFQEDAAAVEGFLSGKRPKASVYLDQDGDFSKSYAVTNLPSLLILKDGTTGFSGKLPRDPDSIISQTIG
jgi:thiol-disulfide isomerase/thioredoxin